MQDLASRYKFPPPAGDAMPHGEEVAENLERLFERHGAPLVVKRDNGGNLNHGAVDALLDRYLVIPAQLAAILAGLQRRDRAGAAGTEARRRG